MFILGFQRAIRNVGGDLYIYKAAVADLEILRGGFYLTKNASPA